MSVHGIINIYKPKGISSFDVIRRVRKIAGQKKMGHLGTLDPLAEGVLPLFMGKMTKLIPFFNTDDKEYIATVQLGLISETLDMEGEKEKVEVGSCSLDEIETALNSFRGKIEQYPPMYSAVKKDGKPLYKYARKGEEVERKPRTIEIYELELLDYNDESKELVIRVFCSKGTYIRVLGDDIAKQLKTRGILSKLIRTKSGRFFNLDNALGLDQIEKNEDSLLSSLLSPRDLLTDWHEYRPKSEDSIKKILHGAGISVDVAEVTFKKDSETLPQTMVFDHRDQMIALGDLEFSQDSFLRFTPVKVLI